MWFLLVIFMTVSMYYAFGIVLVAMTCVIAMMSMFMIVFECVIVGVHMMVPVAVFFISMLVRMIMIMLVFVTVCMLMRMFSLAHNDLPGLENCQTTIQLRYVQILSLASCLQGQARYLIVSKPACLGQLEHMRQTIFRLCNYKTDLC